MRGISDALGFILLGWAVLNWSKVDAFLSKILS